MQPGQIGALTGIRFVAAAWVVLFHIQLFNEGAFGPLEPVVRQGDLGVDLFFLLSGFVLAHNYLDHLGPSPSIPDTGRFLWARLSRIWPLYMVAILLGGALLAVRQGAFGTTPKVPLTLGKFLEQVVMVQQWRAYDVPYSSWAGPAWSISAEWLAYLCFPVLAILVWRLQRHAGPVPTLLAAGLVLVPMVWWIVAAQMQTAPYQWLSRLATEFLCGMLLSAALSTGTPALRRFATRITAPLVVAIIGWCFVADLLGEEWVGALSVIAFPLLVVGLAYGDGRLHRALSAPLMIFGGGISYALYLVHVPLIKFFRDWNDHAWGISDEHRWYAESAVALLSLVLAVVLYRYVEEPARRLLRNLMPSTPRRDVPATDSGTRELTSAPS